MSTTPEQPSTDPVEPEHTPEVPDLELDAPPADTPPADAPPRPAAPEASAWSAGGTPTPGAGDAPAPPPPTAYGEPASGASGQAPPPPAGAYGQAPPPPPGAYGQAPPPASGAYGQAYGQVTSPPLTQSEERGWALGAHLGVLVAGFLAPLIIWLVFKDRGRFLEHHAKESLNFQITVTIAFIVAMITALLLVGIFLALVLVPWMIVMPIIAAVKANSGEWYRYPLTLRLVK